MKHIRFSELAIKNPCSQDWEEMTVIGKDCRMCDSCSKPVYDFTNSTEEDLNRIVRKHGRVCGRFFEDQIGEDIARYSNSTGYSIKFNWVITSFLAVFGFKAADAQSQEFTKPKMVNEWRIDQPDQKMERQQQRQERATDKEARKKKRKRFQKKHIRRSMTMGFL